MDRERAEHHRKELLEMRMELTTELQRMSEEAKTKDGTEAMDSVDLADSSYVKDAKLARVEVINSRIKDIDDAIQRIHEGTYGICEICGEEIPEGRLQARPDARYCTQCKEELERRGEIK